MNKNNETDKHAVDALFARKLGDASLPTPGGFARLQARMGQTKAKKEPGFVVWRNPNAQRFMAIAACLLLACLFGWLYLSNNAVESVQGPQMVTTESGDRPTVDQPTTSPDSATKVPPAEQPGRANWATKNQPVERVAAVAPKTGKQNQTGRPQKQSGLTDDNAVPDARITQNKPTESLKTGQPEPGKANEKVGTPASPDPVAAVRPVATQRVLVVTIAEPERLVAARQAVKMEMMETALATATAPEKAEKPGFWEQVRRVKEGETFARPDGSTEERGLLNRAFNGLKNSIEKDKTARQ